MTVEITGIADLNRVLTTLAPKVGIQLMRTTVYDIAQQVAVSAKENMPDPRTGTLKAETKARRGRGTRTTVESTVNVGGAAFYWRFLEYGLGPDNVEHAMFLKALQALRPDMDRIYLETFGRKLAARLARERKRKGL